MRKLEQLNPLARRMAQALLAALPQFRRRLEVLKNGGFRTHIPAPKGSKAYGLRVCTVNGADTWVQFGVQNAFYDAESERQLLRIVRGLRLGTFILGAAPETRYSRPTNRFTEWRPSEAVPQFGRRVSECGRWA
jgi:hypothetical protein